MDLSRLSVGEGVRRRLAPALSRLSHAYIISGPSGSGKHALAELLAAAYVCTAQGEKPCGACSGCRKAAGDIHPDIQRVTVPEGKRYISVDQVRRLRADAYIRPNEAARKVFVIDDAGAMNDSAQNALLKVLEDGPDYLAFLLLAENDQQLLPTIRSRCETLSLAGQSPAREDDPQRREAAGQLARLLAGGDHRALAEYAAVLESRKWDKDALLALFDEVEAALAPELLRDAPRILPLVEHLRRVRQAIPFNVGAGHLLGWLTAGL